MNKDKFNKKEVCTNNVEIVDKLTHNGMFALEEYMEYNQETINHIVKKACVAALDKHFELALKAFQETGRGVVEDKSIKNLFACEHVTHSMKHLKTVGVIREDQLNGITEIAEPVGVICAMTPTTNPTSTTIFKSLIALKTRNPIIFSFHPSSLNCSINAAKIIRDAAIAAGAPKNCIQWVEKPSMEITSLLMNHPSVSSILATGGNSMVKAAYSCGKPALGVGAGNVPAYIEKTANVKRSVNDIFLSKSFDNGMICASEQAVIVDDEIYDLVIDEFKKLKVYFANDDEKAKLEKFMFGVKATSKNCSLAKLNPDIVGRAASWIAEQAGFTIPKDTLIILVRCSKVGENEPLTREKLSPILAILKAKNTKDGINLADQMVKFDGLGHSAVIHSSNEDIVKEFGNQIKAVRIIWNAPSSQGGIGDLYNAFIPSLTLGCGSYGHNSVSNNVSAIDLLNIKRIGRRNNNMQWFKIPPKIFFEANSIKYLKDMKEIRKVMIITDRSMWKLGVVQKITDILISRQDHVDIELFTEIEPDPSIQTVYKGVELMRVFQPDTLIALGGGSPIDAAKVMWLMYENENINFDDLKQKFLDIRKRAFKYPSLGRKAHLIAIPTTSGTGAEITPFAVISDPKNNQKYPLADYSLTPTIAIIDPILAMTMPSTLAADTGMDVLTHAIEAYVSVFANDFTDGLALKAIQLVFRYLERSVKNGADDPIAKEKLHNAGSIAGMAFANSFLGICHSMSHKIGGRFHTSHGRTNAILLPHVIKYNGTVPTKLSIWPKYESYIANERYQEIAGFLGLKSETPEQGVESLINAVIALAESVGIQMNLKSLGINETEFIKALPDLSMDAYEDQCSPANPRMPMIKDLENIMLKAYYNN
ncbi:bifunctional acetaldehyde-CoA/alcohol dehydrogenase [Francisella sp. 19X1-34]|uniref:bifunctional acetaldehyde-CoA/alcohol dehydrogenase n=1 Tax=Francisella sp. 19X1-34 TaxID=3087177 RepID=UPI002E360BD0|nr:bifunctional acetaldehyde-CoA/alcohol dehydrogenase [Francisella sp. 19X1-34]MED7789277.1 bifunctional acetaldehyde-CoA/alcohol dehydrogenase [Francisella sp. 19X1-34]